MDPSFIGHHRVKLLEAARARYVDRQLLILPPHPISVQRFSQQQHPPGRAERRARAQRAVAAREAKRKLARVSAADQSKRKDERLVERELGNMR